MRHSASQLYAGQAYIVPGVPSIEFAELTTVQADRLLHGSRAVVLLLPIAAVEPHGPHAPLATDGLIASGICERAARALEGDPDVHALVLPPLAYGVTRYAAAFRGAVGITQGTLRLLVTDIGRSLIEDGYRRLVLVNHHFEPEHIEALRAAGDALNSAGGRVALLDLTRRRQAERLTEEFRRGSCHAGRYETSLVLADRPELIDPELSGTLPALDVRMPVEIAEGRRDFLAMGMSDAYCGAPAQASPEEGEDSFTALAQMVVELARELAAPAPDALQRDA